MLEKEKIKVLTWLDRFYHERRLDSYLAATNQDSQSPAIQLSEEKYVLYYNILFA